MASRPYGLSLSGKIFMLGAAKERMSPFRSGCASPTPTCQIRQDRILASTFGPLTPHNSKSPVLIFIVGIRSEELGVPTTYDKLKAVLAAETQCASTALIKLTLHELDIHLVALAERHDGEGGFSRRLTFAAVADREIHDWPSPRGPERY